MESKTCRLCMETEPRDKLDSYCACKNNGVPVLEHRECVSKSIKQRPHIKEWHCMVCRQHYTMTTVFRYKYLFQCAFEYAWKPVGIVLLCKLALLFLFPQLQLPVTSTYSELCSSILVQFILLITKLVQDVTLCKLPTEKEVVISVLFLYIPCFLMLEWLEFKILRIMPLIHSGMVLVYSRYNIRSCLYDFVPLSNTRKRQ